MRRTRYSGTVTTSGNSEAIRLESALFRAHPEFRQKRRVTAAVVAPGQMLISVAVSGDESAGDDDPVFEAFLDFLGEDMRGRPEQLQPLASSAIERGAALVDGIEVRDDEVIPNDITI
jgi:antitoxin PrlF